MCGRRGARRSCGSRTAPADHPPGSRPVLRWLASQKPHERGAREKLKSELGGDLMGAVSQLAREYPLGMPQLVA